MVAQFTNMVNEGNGKIGLTAICPYCANEATVHGVDVEGFQRWLMGELIQSALPDLSPGQRETLQSGYHDACFDLDYRPPRAFVGPAAYCARCAASGVGACDDYPNCPGGMN